MNFFSKLIVIILIVLAIMYVKDNFIDNIPNTTNKDKVERPIFTKDIEVKDIKKKTNTQNEVAIYFTNAKNGNLKKLHRELPETQNRMTYAINELIKGPSLAEKNQGYSSEIPKGTKILGLKDQGGIIVLDLSNEFQYGGGTESQYTRVEQLIKTVVELNLEKPIYLYINGQKAEVIGGEGIIINQPLSENSLNE